jgi:hypothetical protein
MSDKLRLETSPNPKLLGSKIIDCIPQTGLCPNRCNQCFYNRPGAFYRPIDTPLLPTLEQANGKIVRVNSGHDSNVNRDQVLVATKQYPNRFYNTSIPQFDFPAPVVFTCNGHRLILVPNPPKNLMFVRFRLATDNLAEADLAVRHYWVKHGTPVVMTFMRYYEKSLVPDLSVYEFRQHVLKDYWILRPEIVLQIMSRWAKLQPPILGVRMCGTPYSSMCADCCNCEFLYWDCLRRM